jgi:hypothetical protein
MLEYFCICYRLKLVLGIFFNLSSQGNGFCNSSAEKHLKKSKTNRGFYLYLKLSTFVKIFYFYLVPQYL